MSQTRDIARGAVCGSPLPAGRQEGVGALTGPTALGRQVGVGAAYAACGVPTAWASQPIRVAVALSPAGRRRSATSAVLGQSITRQ